MNLLSSRPAMTNIVETPSRNNENPDILARLEIVYHTSL